LVRSITFMFWRVNSRAVGPFLFFSAVTHAAAVSVGSAGRITVTFGMQRNAASCSTGSWVGPSSPT
jgi:hypothetical protein